MNIQTNLLKLHSTPLSIFPYYQDGVLQEGKIMLLWLGLQFIHLTSVQQGTIYYEQLIILQIY